MTGRHPGGLADASRAQGRGDRNGQARELGKNLLADHGDRC
jgi:hypothetical protein